MLSYTIFFMLNICFDSLLVSNEVKNVFPASGVYKNMNYLAQSRRSGPVKIGFPGKHEPRNPYPA